MQFWCSGQCWPRPAARPEQGPLQLLCSVSTPTWPLCCLQIIDCGLESEGGTLPTETGAELGAAGEVSEHEKPAGSRWDSAGPISRMMQALLRALSESAMQIVESRKCLHSPAGSLLVNL